jgi:hypothetical protein
MPSSKTALGAMFAVCLLVSGMVQAGWQDILKSAADSLGGTGSSSSSTSASVLSNDQIIQGLKEALSIGAEKAIGILGREGGYLDDAQVKIPLPSGLKSVAKGLRSFGQGELVDEFEMTINRAAERAVPETLAIFGDTIREMSVQDARGILDGGDTAATDYFKEKSSGRLTQAILPIVQRATREAGVTAAYKGLVSQVGFLGNYVDMSSLDLDNYVTTRALDGLFLKLAEQEQLIRRDPVARTTDILKTVFGR